MQRKDILAMLLFSFNIYTKNKSFSSKHPGLGKSFQNLRPDNNQNALILSH